MTCAGRDDGIAIQYGSGKYINILKLSIDGQCLATLGRSPDYV